MPFKMSQFVFWSGVYNAGLASVLLFPALYRLVGLNIPMVLAWLFSGFLAFTSAVLILSARDLPNRAVFVYWESLLRYAAALVLIPAGLLSDIGWMATPLGLADLAIGLTYMFGLPREFGVSHSNLLRDRAASNII